MSASLKYNRVSHHAHVITAEQTIEELKSNEDSGLTETERQTRTNHYGPNAIPEHKGKGAIERLWEQINSVLIYILVCGAVLSFAFHHNIDGIVIISVVVLNVLLGFFMESQAVNATETLQKMMSQHAQVLRDGIKQMSLSVSLTLGDMFFLRPGDVVPADGRVVQATSLAVQEASLTGESHVVHKVCQPVSDVTVPLAERHCIVYSGTQVMNGSASCIVTATGGECEIGKVSKLLGEVKAEKTSLLVQLEHFGRVLSVVIVTMAAITFVAAYLRGLGMNEGLSTAIGVAVAAIPEGLPSCITVAFAVGVSLMAKKGAIVKSLPAVETLGSVSVICSDKTGTLTMNEMELQTIILREEVIVVSLNVLVLSLSTCYPWLDQTETIATSSETKNRVLDLLFPAILCNNSSVVKESGSPAPAAAVDVESQLPAIAATAEQDTGPTKPTFYRVEGSSTEACILRLALRCLEGAGADLIRLQMSAPRLSELPFDSTHKFMATVHSMGEMEIRRLFPLQSCPANGMSRCSSSSSSDASVGSKLCAGTLRVLLVKGAPEILLTLCFPVKSAGKDDDEYLAWCARSETCASEGVRVIGIAAKVIADDFSLTLESVMNTARDSGEPLLLMGLLGIVDPPRPEAIDAVREAQRAGIIVKMITGDHPSTALAISDRLGLRTTEGVVTGAQLDVLLRDANTAELDKTVLRTDVFARTTPEHKLRIVESLRRQHIVCSMTGDGVNDAPALKAANIGVAMGITGTEVAKEAANMIITDDNFATIVDAIRIGRTTYGNLIKIITFVLSVNGGQAFSVLGALVIGVDVPITALQILWVNMLISVSLGIELAFDKSEAHVMTQRPRHVDKRIFGRLLRWRVGFASLLFVCVVLGIYHWEQQRKGYDVVYLRTCSVNAMVISQAMYIFNCHDLRRNVSLSKMFLENWLIYVGLLLVGIFQAVLTYTRPFQLVFEVTAIDGVSWGKILLLSMALFLVVEVEKAVSAQIARLRRG